MGPTWGQMSQMGDKCPPQLPTKTGKMVLPKCLQLCPPNRGQMSSKLGQMSSNLGTNVPRIGDTCLLPIAHQNRQKRPSPKKINLLFLLFKKLLQMVDKIF